ncbi:hypothetical protein G9A89_008681, partial [Geosiphon pyriformis]
MIKSMIELLILKIGWLNNNISSVDFYHKVKPFARILTGTLYEVLLHHYLVPGSYQKSAKTKIALLNINLEIILNCYFEAVETDLLHRLCDNKGATVSVIKVKGTGQIIGGFNPQSWHSRDQRLDGKGSFIFSLGDDNAENAILGKFVTGYGPFSGTLW